MKNFHHTLKTAALALLFTQNIAAQSALTGTVRDEHHEPVPFATVALVEAATERAVQSGATDGYGQFQFDGVAAGKYFVKVKSAALGELFSKKLAVCGTAPIELPDLFYSKNAGAAARRAAIVEPPVTRAEVDEMVFLKE